MNLSIRSGTLETTDKEKNWFSSKRIEYIYPLLKNSDFHEQTEILTMLNDKTRWIIRTNRLLARHSRMLRHHWGGKISGRERIAKRLRSQMSQ